MDKRGLVFSAVTYIPRLIFVGVGVAIVFFLIYSYVQTDFQYAQLRGTIVYERLTNGDISFAYREPFTRRVYNGYLAKDPPTDILTSAIFYGENQNYIGARLLRNQKPDSWAYNAPVEAALKSVGDSGVQTVQIHTFRIVPENNQWVGAGVNGYVRVRYG